MATKLHKILIVDDEEILRAALLTVLDSEDYIVKAAKNGEEALIIAKSFEPELILLDLIMPGINGIETCRLLKQMPGIQNTSIVFLTARTDPDTISAAFNVGAVDFMVKPVNWEILQNRVGHILRNQELAQSLRTKEQELFNAQRNAGVGTFRINTNIREIELSSSAKELLGITVKESILPLSVWLERVHPDDRTHVEFAIFHAADDKNFCILEYRFAGKGGKEIIINQHSEPVYEADEPDEVKLIGSLKDVTESRRAHDELEHQRLYDTLTGLANRLFFESQIRHILAHPPKDLLFTIAFIGLDHFTRINDSFGHSGGDFVLKKIAQRLGRYEYDGNVVCRFGGDIFAMLIKNIRHINESDILIEEILQTIRKPILFGGNELFVTASVGASVFPLESENASLLLNGAESAMKFSRDDGGDRLTYRTSDMNKKAKFRAEMLREMRGAIKNKQFVPYYQLQIDSASMKIIGMEALVRWHHPEKGCIFPVDFIELAEETGLIVPIGELVLWQAAIDTKRWREMGFDIRVGINVSPKQFEEADVCSQIAYVLEEVGLTAHALEVEITESMAMKDPSATIFKLNKLRNMGIKISMDDFGTGFSSLSQLQTLPLDTLKVDQAFVRCIQASEKNSNEHPFKNDAIAVAVIAMAHSMGLQVIAEGVETPDQHQFLVQHQCEVLQGFLFGKPIPAEEFEKLLQNWDSLSGALATDKP